MLTDPVAYDLIDEILSELQKCEAVIGLLAHRQRVVYNETDLHILVIQLNHISYFSKRLLGATSSSSLASFGTDRQIIRQLNRLSIGGSNSIRYFRNSPLLKWAPLLMRYTTIPVLILSIKLYDLN